jgi:hypothetical protein
MFNESLLATLVGGAIGFFSAIGVIMVHSWLESRKKRHELIHAIEAAARSSTTPAVLSAYIGGPVRTNIAEQFLSTFWKDLAILGTYTQLMVVTYFSMLIDATKMEGGPSKDMIDSLMDIQQRVLGLIEKEAKGQRQNIDRNRLPHEKSHLN